MYTIQAGKGINSTILKGAIEYNEKLRKGYDKLDDYYLGNHEIQQRAKEEGLKNNKVVVNHAKFITDVNVGYLLGNPVDYQIDDDYDATPILDMYKRQTISDLDHEIAEDTSILGRQYEIAFLDGNTPLSAEFDVKNCVFIHDDTVQHKPICAVVYDIAIGTNGKTIYNRCTVYDTKNITEWGNGTESLAAQKPTPHVWQDIPIIDYRNNPNLLGDFEPVIPLINAYNLLISDRINDNEQSVESILAIFGAILTEEQQSAVKKTRMLMTTKTDARAEYVNRAYGEDQIDVLLKRLESNIHKISMTPNLTDENFVGNSSGVAIKYKLIAFEQSIMNKQRYFEKGLLKRFRLYNNYLVATSKMSQIIPLENVHCIFKRNLPQNDLEASQMIMNLRGMVSDETLLSQLGFISNPEEEVKKALEESIQSVSDSSNQDFGVTSTPAIS